MDAETLNLTKIFKQDIRYVVPLFQRPYVWNEEEHWLPLWDDIRVVAERVLEADDFMDDESAVPPHFLGAVVIDHTRTPVGELAPWAVIDGQQRFTTLQLLMDAARDVAQARGFEKEARLLSKLLENDEDLVRKPEEQFKVWPTNADREAFQAVMAGLGKIDHRSRIAKANAFFQQQIEEWLDEAGEDEHKQELRVSAVSSTLRHHLKLVVISLQEQDNAQVIFETLNARGTPLLASDLVKNLLFQRLAEERQEVEPLYLAHWVDLENEFWRSEITQGRLRRPRLDVFLYHWLMMTTERELVAHQLFPEFRRHVGLPETDTLAVLRDLGGAASHYADLDQALQGDGPYDWDSFEGQFFYRMGELEVGTTLPLFLWLLGPGAEHTTPVQRRRLYLAIESWLFRRNIARYGTKGYSRLFLDLLREVKADPARADEVALEYLRSSTAESAVWPSDDELRRAFIHNPIYRQLRRSRTRVILEALERAKRSSRTEPLGRGHKLTIEHLLPQKWEHHWPLPPGEPVAQKVRREELVHTIGNLTLVTALLNGTQSNSAWPVKREALREHSLLVLNRELCEQVDVWDETAIERRSRELAEIAIGVWPGPTGDWTAEIPDRR